jgi:hypothetical protein
MKLYFVFYCFLFVVFAGVYGNLCDTAAGYPDCDGSVLHISRPFTPVCFNFGCNGNIWAHHIAASVGRDISVGIASGYGLDGPGIVSQLG